MSFLFGVAVKKKAQAIRDLVAAGTNYSLALENGRAWGWGYNGGGRVGNNSILATQTPVTVLGAVKTFCKISAGANHSLAIDKNGRAWCWGTNGSGQLGDNSITSRLTPVSVLGSRKTFCHIAASLGLHSLAIDKNGRAWAWGDNSNGRLGDNTLVSKRTPISVLGAVKTFCKIAAGNAWSMAIDKNGRAWAWGNGGDGRLGNNSTVSALTPVSVRGAVKTFCHIAAGNAHSAAIDKYGIVWSWGFNNSGQLGNGANTSQLTPVSLAGVRKTFCKISLSNGQTLAIDKYGKVWGWGFNANALLGDNSVTARNTPVSLGGESKIFCEIAAGNQHALAIDKNGKTWAWGPINGGGLGANIFAFISTPKAIVLGATKTFCEISIGTTFSTAIDQYKRVWAWGTNAAGQVGDNSTTTRYTPVSVLGALKSFCKIFSGPGHSLAIDKNGRVWAWGQNGSGRLGDNSTTGRLTPVSVVGSVKTFCSIAAGNNHSSAIDKNGRVWTWGNNGYSQLGDGSITARLTPVSVAGAVKTFCQLSAGIQFSIGLTNSGRLWGWGDNYGGQIGNPATLVSANTPVSITGAVKTFCKIASGSYHSLAIDKNGKIWGWGYNDFGGLGNNTAGAQVRTPVSVVGATTAETFCHIAVCLFSSFGIDKYGKLWAWGQNDFGQLGDNTTFSRLTPVTVAGISKTFCSITANQNWKSAMATDNRGKIWAWGSNSGGQLPIQPENPVVLTPIKVCTI